METRNTMIRPGFQKIIDVWVLATAVFQQMPKPRQSYSFPFIRVIRDIRG